MNRQLSVCSRDAAGFRKPYHGMTTRCRRICGIGMILWLVPAGKVAADIDPIHPFVDCVRFDETAGLFEASFGYNNTNPEEVVVLIGPDNFFVPGPHHDGAPVVFQPGVHRNVFSVFFSSGETLTWELLGTIVTAEADPALYCVSFTYQGHLSDGGGPASGTYDFEFTLWDNDVGGNQVGPTLTFDGMGDNPAPVTVTDGLFTVVLAYDSDVFAANPRTWLEVAVNGTLLAPRQRINPAPHASFAHFAADPPRLWQRSGTVGNHISNTNSGNVGIGTSSPSVRLAIGDDGTGVHRPSANVLALHTNANERLRIAGNGNVGIGTTAPSNRLSVAGNANITGNLGIGTAAPRQDLSIGAHLDLYSGPINDPTRPSIRANSANNLILSASDSGAVLINRDGGTGGIRFHDGTGGGEVMRITGNGRVGIARTNPAHPLHVGTDSTNGNGAHVTEGGVWTNGSDRNSKQHFEPVDKQEILRKVAELPITRWQYKGEREHVRHIGPVAQDFHAAFELGDSDMHITTVDADGIAFAAIQGLHEIVQEKDAEIAALRTEKDAETQSLRHEIEELKDMLRRISAGKGE